MNDEITNEIWQNYQNAKHIEFELKLALYNLFGVSISKRVNGWQLWDCKADKVVSHPINKAEYAFMLQEAIQWCLDNRGDKLREMENERLLKTGKS